MNAARDARAISQQFRPGRRMRWDGAVTAAPPGRMVLLGQSNAARIAVLDVNPRAAAGAPLQTNASIEGFLLRASTGTLPKAFPLRQHGATQRPGPPLDAADHRRRLHPCRLSHLS